VIFLRDLYRNDGLVPLALQPGEILTDVLLLPAAGVRAAYHKVRARGAIDFPAVGVAVAVHAGPDGTVTDARIVLGAVASAPLMVAQATQALVGGRLDGETIRLAAEAASRAARPLENADVTGSWRKQMAAVAARRALQAIAVG
jgi:CO/xanthine dehydrogenase FAD-binding subunit